MPERHDDFYVGYRPHASPAVRDHVRKVVAFLFALAIVVPFLLASGQGEFSNGVFEFGNVRTFAGRLAAAPYAVLHVEDGGGPHYLVELGKRGAREELGALDGRELRVEGQLIHRDRQRMIELTADTPEPLAATGREPATPPRSLGRQRLTGEILDSKCYLGVMKPGRGKPHRDCATRCISGGIPPLFVATDRRGERLYLLLTDAAGGPLGSELLHMVAEPVAVEGEVVLADGLRYLRAAPEDFERLGGAS